VYKVVLNKGTAYFDPKTRTNLFKSKNFRTFTAEELKNYDMSNIYFAVSVGILKEYGSREVKEDTRIVEPVEETIQKETLETEELPEETATEEEITEDVIEETEEAAETTTLEAFTADGRPRCQSLKNDNETQCANAAKYPEDNPIYCGAHKNKLEE